MTSRERAVSDNGRKRVAGWARGTPNAGVANPEVEAVHAHFARRGCYAALIERL